MAVIELPPSYERRPYGVLLLWGLGVAATLLVVGIGMTMASAPVSALVAGVAVNAALLAVAVMIGAFVAPRCGLTSLMVRATPITPAIRRDLIRFAVAGLLLGAVVAGVDAALFATVPSLAVLIEKHAEFVRSATAITPGIVIVRMVYGGVIEEILVRWCLLALLAWILMKIEVRRPLAIGIAILVSALLFGALHLPATFHAFGDPPIVMIGRVVILNALVGVAFGVVFARNSLEAAMACHAATHLGLLLSGTSAL